MNRPSVIILCTGNSCRSHMAEGLLRAACGERFDVFSAGSHPAGYVHPLAIRALSEVDIDLSRHTSKGLDEFAGRTFDFVITVCGNARDSCPNLRGDRATLHWPMDDPARLHDDPDRALALARKVRDDLNGRLRTFIADVDAGRYPSTGSGAARSRQTSWVRRLAFRILALLLALAVLTGLGEVGLRVFHPQPTGFYAFDDFSLPDGSPRPGASGILCGVPVTINADAERGRDFDLKKPPGVTRVCILGDSLVFGLGVADEDRYPVVTGRLLAQRYPNRSIEVLPFGQVAYRLSGYRTRLLPKALAYHPDIVVIGFVLNDFEPPPATGTGPQATTLTPGPTSGAMNLLKSLTGRLRKHSHLVYFLRKKTQELLSTTLMSRDDLIRNWELDAMYADTNAFRAEWEYTVRQLNEIQALCTAAGAKLLVLVTPFDIQMNSDRLAFYRRTVPDLPDSVLDCIPQSQLSRYCADHDVPFIDLTSAFRQSKERVFFQLLEGRIDLCHPTTAGHRLIAEALAGKLDDILVDSKARSQSPAR